MGSPLHAPARVPPTFDDWPDHAYTCRTTIPVHTRPKLAVRKSARWFHAPIFIFFSCLPTVYRHASRNSPVPENLKACIFASVRTASATRLVATVLHLGLTKSARRLLESQDRGAWESVRLEMGFFTTTSHWKHAQPTGSISALLPLHRRSRWRRVHILKTSARSSEMRQY
ncbi:hypothetical protein FKP32DRAFT_143540 [Trametes sanguinea]|nr:hypothetical protein FKP32DRAFT_143540 [Trametes sanguinea]